MTEDISVGVEQDDVFATDTDTGTTPTLLDGLRDELKQEVRNDPITLVVPGRPNISLVCDTNLESKTIQAWRKRCVDKRMPDNFDGLKFGCIVIANTCTSIVYKGTEVARTDGRPMTFRDEALLDMLGAQQTVVDAVRWLFGVDAHIFQAAEDIFKAAGFDNDEDSNLTVDPTVLS